VVLDFLGPDRWHASFFVGDKSLRALVREKADAGVVSKIQGYPMILAICAGLLAAAPLVAVVARALRG